MFGHAAGNDRQRECYTYGKTLDDVLGCET